MHKGRQRSVCKRHDERSEGNIEEEDMVECHVQVWPHLWMTGYSSLLFCNHSFTEGWLKEICDFFFFFCKQKQWKLIKLINWNANFSWHVSMLTLSLSSDTSIKLLKKSEISLNSKRPVSEMVMQNKRHQGRMRPIKLYKNGATDGSGHWFSTWRWRMVATC